MKAAFSLLLSLLVSLSVVSPAAAWTPDEPPLKMMVVHLSATQTNFCDEYDLCLNTMPLKDDRAGLCTPQRMFLLASNNKLPLQHVAGDTFARFSDLKSFFRKKNTVAYVRLYTCKGENGEALYDVGETAHAMLCVTRGKDGRDGGPILCTPVSVNSY